MLCDYISGHLNSEQVKVCYSDVSAIQMFAIQIPTVLSIKFHLMPLHKRRLGNTDV